VRSDAAILLVIGALALIGAAALAWYASLASLALDKAAGRGATAEIVRKLAGIVPVGSDAVAGVVAVKMVESREPGSRSHTPPRLVFVTDAGIDRDLGYDQQRFANDFATIRDFLADATQSRLALSSACDGTELVRFVAGHLAVLFLGAIGVLAIRVGIRKLRGLAE